MSALPRSVSVRTRAAIGALASAGLLLSLATGCSGGREARLQEVLRRSRAAPETITALEKPFLEDAEADVRALAVWAIGDARAPDAIEVLAPLAKDPDERVRLAVVHALCPLDVQRAPEAVTALAADVDPETRRAAIRCIAEKPEPAPGILPAALTDPDRVVRAAALEGLRRHPEPEAREALVAVVTTRGAEEQLAAVEALRALADPAAAPGLEKAAAERLSPAVRDAVEAAILELRRSAAESEAAEAPTGKPGPPANRKQPVPKRAPAASRPAGEHAPDAPTGDATKSAPEGDATEAGPGPPSAEPDARP